MKIGCIGTGAMGGAIMRAVCKKYDVSQIKVTDKNVEMGKAFAAETGATFSWVLPWDSFSHWPEEARNEES